MQGVVGNTLHHPAGPIPWRVMPEVLRLFLPGPTGVKASHSMTLHHPMRSVREAYVRLKMLQSRYQAAVFIQIVHRFHAHQWGFVASGEYVRCVCMNHWPKRLGFDLDEGGGDVKTAGVGVDTN